MLVALFAFVAATAQEEHSINIDPNSFRAVHSDALTGVNIDPIAKDLSRNACARVKIRFANMSKAEIEALEIKFRSNTDLAKCKVADYFDNILILEMTAKPNTRFYVKSPEYGESNVVTLNLEGDCVYEMEARLNQSFSIVVDSNIEGAEVYIDGNFKGRTDSNSRCTISDVMIGAHKLKMVYGSVSSEQSIEVNKSSISFRQDLNVAVERFDANFKIQPANATIVIDGNGMALPVSNGALNLKLPKGNHTYEVSANGYHSKSGKFVITDKAVNLAVELKMDAATVTLTAPNNAEIWVNGEKKGEGRWSGVLYSGRYTFEARAESHRTTTLIKIITSELPQQSYSLAAPTPIYGSLMVDTNPQAAEVVLDGVVVGQTPLNLDKILIGGHTLKISKRGYATETKTVTIAEAECKSVTETLTKEVVANNQIVYTTVNDETINLIHSAPYYFGANIVSHKYTFSNGVILFNGDVTEIGPKVFFCYRDLKSVTLPNSVKTIGGQAFYYCDNLESVIIGKAVTTIGAEAFYKCGKLTSINIPDGVTQIGSKAFYGCLSLEKVTIPSSVTKIGAEAFESCGGELIVNSKIVETTGRLFVHSNFTKLIIGNNITKIGRSAFESCSKLKSVTIPDSVTAIESYAFYFCSSLTDLTIGNNVTRIGFGAFDYCRSLTSVTIPDSVTHIGDGAFNSCDNLKSVTIGSGVTNIDPGAFRNCENLAAIYCKSTTPPTLRDKDVFEGCAKSRIVYVPLSAVDAYKKAKYWKNAGKIVGQ